ncbi:MAG: hypothetical protein NTV79_02195, partial [Candidatus Aureabacteria bacterium]|nr:hypothetical protein [Candidatus Auribacterota bacterium]
MNLSITHNPRHKKPDLDIDKSRETSPHDDVAGRTIRRSGALAAAPRARGDGGGAGRRLPARPGPGRHEVIAPWTLGRGAGRR